MSQLAKKAIVNSKDFNKEELPMIEVIDSPCGTGKTSYAINKINGSKDKVVFVTPFLTEVDRIIESCPDMNAPSKDENSTKLEDFKSMLADGKSIVTTHSLFKGFDQECYELIKAGGYSLILDEVVSTIKDYPLKHSDINMMLKANTIDIVGEHQELVWIDNEYDGIFNKFRVDVTRGNVYLVELTEKKSAVYWEMPLEKFVNFKDITILTYLFEGQEMSCYFKMNAIPYTLYSLKDYKKVPYDKTLENREELKKLVNVYDGKANSNYNGTLSANFYSETIGRGKNKTKKNAKDIAQIRKNAEGYFKNTLNAPNTSILWSCYNDDMKDLKFKRCTPKNFLVFNSRATNDYRDRSNLAYLINVYLNPNIAQYFHYNGVTLDQDLYAVSTLIQWICRSAVRDGKPVNLYLPSQRMRDLLNKFFNYEI